MKRFADIAFAACLVLFLAAVALGTFLRNSGETSFFENRALAERPALTAEGVASGDYFDQWEEWFTDHAVGRTTLLKLNTWLEMELLGMPVVNDVVITPDCLLGYNSYNRWDTDFLEEEAADFAASLADLSAYVEERGGVFCFVGLPEQYGYFSDKYPDWLESRAWYLEPLRQAVFSAMEEAGVAALDGDALFTSLGHPDRFYAASDHHFTYEGALVTYQALIDLLNRDFGLGLAAAEVEVREVANPFLGSRNRKLSGLWRGEEALSIGALTEPVPFRRWDNGEEVEASLYALPDSPETYVTYEVYMGGDVGETVLRTDRPELPNALIFGDSFTNALETMLYASFNETRSVDLRHYTDMTIRAYIDRYQPDVVIYVRDETTYFSTEGNGNLA